LANFAGLDQRTARLENQGVFIHDDAMGSAVYPKRLYSLVCLFLPGHSFNACLILPGSACFCIRCVSGMDCDCDGLNWTCCRPFIVSCHSFRMDAFVGLEEIGGMLPRMACLSTDSLMDIWIEWRRDWMRGID